MLRAGPKRHEIFVFRVHNDITDDSLKEFLTGEHLTVIDMECVSQDSSWTKSYRIVIESNDLSAILDPDFWPEGIGCRRFWRKKAQQPT